MTRALLRFLVKIFLYSHSFCFIIPQDPSTGYLSSLSERVA